MLAGLDDERAVRGEQALAALQRLLDQHGRAEVPVQRRFCVDALVVQVETGYAIDHLSLLFSRAAATAACLMAA